MARPVTGARTAGVHATRRGAVRLSLLVTLALALAAPSPALAATRGLNHWYWPTGTSDTGTMGGWMQYRSWNGSWHLAKDISRAAGRPVYALTDGVVYDVQPSIDEYGPGGGKGGAMVVLFRTDDGRPFKALYGHIYSIRYRKGQRVLGGATLALVNASSPNHLHFGIHPGDGLPTDPEHNIYRGHTHVRTQAYGWTDPVAFLTTRRPLGAPALVTPPSIPATVPVGIRPVGGLLAWRKPAGRYDVTVRVWTLSHGAWLELPARACVNVDAGTITRYVGTVRLTRAGAYRLQAVTAADGVHPAVASRVVSVLALP